MKPIQGLGLGLSLCGLLGAALVVGQFTDAKAAKDTFVDRGILVMAVSETLPSGTLTHIILSGATVSPRVAYYIPGDIVDTLDVGSECTVWRTARGLYTAR